MSPPISPTRCVLTVTEDDEDLNLDALLIDDSFSKSQGEVPAASSLASWSPRPSIPIKAIEEDIAGATEWILPPPSQLGDFLSGSLHRVPSKSILKKTSSYANFDMNDSVSLSKLGKKKHSKSSFLSFDVSVNSGGAGSGSASRQGSDFGLDLDSSSQSQMSTPYLGVAKIASSDYLPESTVITPENTVHKSIKPADAAAGTLDTSLGSSRLSTSGKMRRNVSFHAVDVREYDRTVGDNPSCRSGPPLSLDWSYSKASTKTVDDFELERSFERVKHPARLRVSKYTRRNILAFHWGHSQEEMKKARSETKKLQRQRSLTQILLPVHMAHEACISIKNLISKKNKELSGDDLSELSLSMSKHSDSISRQGSGMNEFIQGSTSPRVHATEPAETPLSSGYIHEDAHFDDA